MKFIHTDLGNRRRGEIVEVTLTRAANVRLMNTSNFNNSPNYASRELGRCERCV